MTRALHPFLFFGLIAFSQVQAQQKDYYYENQTRYGAFRNYVNGGSKLVTTFRGETDYTAGMGAGQQEAKRMTAERERQRQIEFERMRNSSKSNQSNSNQVSSNHTAVNDVRFETLKFSSGNTYIGKTLNGEPHGEGTVTFTSDGRVMKGEFKNGQANGMMTITDKLYVQTGKFVNGKPVGDQRYEFDDGKTKLVEIRNMETGASTIQYPDRTSFSGISDENGKYLKGKVLYTSGITFDGDYINGRPYRGVWEKDGRVMIGEFGESTPTELYLKFGYHYDARYKEQTYGNYTPGMKRIGYSRRVSPDNTVQHYIYGENETEIYVYVQFPGDNLLSLKANQDGYKYLGTYYKAATNEMDAVIYSKQNGIQVIPADNPLSEKAKTYSREVAPAINAGKQQYEAKLKEVEPYIAQYNEIKKGEFKKGNTTGNTRTTENKPESASTINSTNTATTSNTASTITFHGGVYTGELNDAKQPHGKGTYKSADGSYTYEGNYVNGKPMGKGKSTWKSGEMYEGDFVDGNRQGKGKTTLANGDVYEGELVDGLWHGKGKLTDANGKIVVGVWYQGELDPKPIMTGTGKAKFVWDDKVYEGAFVNGKRTGKGKMTHSNGTIAQGDYVDGSLSGKGKISWGDGNSYEGDFVKNQLNGKGNMIYANGDIYEGEFSGGLANGKGKMTHVNGNSEEGNWANGVFKGNK